MITQLSNSTHTFHCAFRDCTETWMAKCLISRLLCSLMSSSRTAKRWQMLARMLDDHIFIIMKNIKTVNIFKPARISQADFTFVMRAVNLPTNNWMSLETKILSVKVLKSFESHINFSLKYYLCEVPKTNYERCYPLSLKETVVNSGHAVALVTKSPHKVWSTPFPGHVHGKEIQ